MILIFNLCVRLIPLVKNITESDLLAIGWVHVTNNLIEKINDYLFNLNLTINYKRVENYIAQVSYESNCGRWIEDYTSFENDPKFSFEIFNENWIKNNISNLIDEEYTDVTITKLFFNNIGYNLRHRFFCMIHTIFVVNFKYPR